MANILKPEAVEFLDWDNWNSLRSYIERTSFKVVPLHTHIDTLRYYIINMVREGNITNG